MSKVQIFLSYSHEDRRWVEPGPWGLIPWLAQALKRDGVEFWYDPELRTLPGEDFKRRIRLEITKARFACLLISQDFVNSDFIRHLELPWIRERLERDELSIIPILVAPTLWEQEDELSWLTERQMLPGTPTPLIDYAGDEGRWKAVRNEILAAIRSRIREASGQTAPVVGPSQQEAAELAPIADSTRQLFEGREPPQGGEVLRVKWAGNSKRLAGAVAIAVSCVLLGIAVFSAWRGRQGESTSHSGNLLVGTKPLSGSPPRIMREQETPGSAQSAKSGAPGPTDSTNGAPVASQNSGARDTTRSGDQQVRLPLAARSAKSDASGPTDSTHDGTVGSQNSGARDTTSSDDQQVRLHIVTTLGTEATVPYTWFSTDDQRLSRAMDGDLLLRIQEGTYLVVPRNIFREAQLVDKKHVITLSTGKKLTGVLACSITADRKEYSLSSARQVRLLGHQESAKPVDNPPATWELSVDGIEGDNVFAGANLRFVAERMVATMLGYAQALKVVDAFYLEIDAAETAVNCEDFLTIRFDGEMVSLTAPNGTVTNGKMFVRMDNSQKAYGAYLIMDLSGGDGVRIVLTRPVFVLRNQAKRKNRPE